MKNVYSFIDITKEQAFATFVGKVLNRNYTRFQHGYCNGNLECVICWVVNEPHVTFRPETSKRIKLEGTISFIKQHPNAIIRTLKSTKRLFDGVCKRSELKERSKSLDVFGRGVEYIYGV